MIGVAPDGSPVAVYRAIPDGLGFEQVIGAVTGRPRVLDLGCGTGRLANVLAASGHAVVGIDQSAEMLAHVDPAVEAIHADIETLDLGRTFDAVVLGGNLVTVADVGLRRRFLETCTRHVADDGVVLIERYAPEWIAAVERHVGIAGPVETVFEVLDRRGPEFDGQVTYRLEGREWTQSFTGRAIGDDELERASAEVGLVVRGWLDEDGQWIEASRHAG